MSGGMIAVSVKNNRKAKLVFCVWGRGEYGLERGMRERPEGSVQLAIPQSIPGPRLHPPSAAQTARGGPGQQRAAAGRESPGEGRAASTGSRGYLF